MRLRFTFFIWSIWLILLPGFPFAGCAHPGTAAQTVTAPALQGDAAHPGHAVGWVDTKLYFGLGPADHPEQGVSEAQWRDFLDEEVTPRFPDGLSVLDVYGQWQGKGEAAPERLRSKLLIIDYPDNQENRAKIDAIRAAWKKMTGDQSVLKVTEPANVSF
jgi:Protein of unknown function (DUF3574)